MVSTLVLVAIAAALASSVMWRGATAISQVENSRDHAQAQWMARAAVSYARWVLEVDAQAESLMDHLAEPWAQQIPLTSVQDLFPANLSREDAVLLGRGRFTGGLADAQGRFNVAHLVADGQRRPYGFGAVGILFDMAGTSSNFEAFVREMEQVSAQERQHGVSPSLRARQARLMLALEAAGLPQAGQAWLMDRLVWLPEPTAVNVNTASAEVISAALLLGDQSAVSGLISARERYPMRTLAEISALVSSPEGFSMSRVDVKSQYFRATGLAQFGRAQFPFEAWMLRRGGRTEVLAYGERGVL